MLIPDVLLTMITEEPKMQSPVGVPTLTALKNIVLPSIDVIYAPVAIPVPATDIPTTNPVLLPTTTVFSPTTPDIDVTFIPLV